MGWLDLMAQAHRQQEVLALGKARRFELDPRQVRRRADAEGWPELYPDVRLLPGARRELPQRVSAVVEAVGDPILLTGIAALFLRGAWLREPRLLEFVMPHSRDVVDLDDPTVVVRRSRTLIAGDYDGLDGLPLGAPARNLADAAAKLALPRLRASALDLQHVGGIEPADLWAFLDTHRHFPCRPKYRRLAIDLARLHGDSTFEWDVREAVAGSGLQPHPVPFPWRTADGRVLHLDVAFPDEWVYLDVIGDAFHGPTVAPLDRKRWNATDAGGWRRVMVGWESRHELAAVVAQLRQRLAEADPSRAPAPRAQCGCGTCTRAARELGVA